MIKHAESHLDHSLTEEQLAYVMRHYGDRTSFFIDTFELPNVLGTVPCGLYGPMTGNEPVDEAEVHYATRGDRTWPSRLIDRPLQLSRFVTIIAGPHEEPCPTCKGSGEMHAFHGGPKEMCPCEKCSAPSQVSGKGTGKIAHACIIYTVYGGPCAPQEPDDPQCRDIEASKKFWALHALVK